MLEYRCWTYEFLRRNSNVKHWFFQFCPNFCQIWWFYNWIVLGCYRTKDFSVVVVHTRTQLIFPHPHCIRTRTQIHHENVLIKCLLIPKKFKKKISKNFFGVSYHWTGHLDVRDVWITVQVGSFLRIMCCVWTTTTTTVVVCTLLWCGNSLDCIYHHLLVQYTLKNH